MTTVGDEPASGARIQIRMPDAKRLVRKFAPEDTVKSIYAFVAVSVVCGISCLGQSERNSLKLHVLSNTHHDDSNQTTKPRAEKSLLSVQAILPRICSNLSTLLWKVVDLQGKPLQLGGSKSF